MKNYVLFLFLVHLMYADSLAAWSWWPAKKKKEETVQDRIEYLQRKQVDAPHDPFINYNLGVAYYKDSQFDSAYKCFDRALVATVDDELKRRSLFNAGNSAYQGAVVTLGSDWQNKKLEQAVAGQALALLQSSIKKYDDLLSLQADHQAAITNKKEAVKLLQELQKKIQKDQPQDGDKKNDGQQQGQQPSDGKDGQRQQDKQQDSSGDKQGDKQEGGQQSSQENKQDGEQQGDKKTDQPHKDGKQQSPAPDKRGDDNKDGKGKQEPKQNDRKDSPDNVDDKRNKGKGDPAEDQGSKDHQQQNAQNDSHEKTPHNKKPDSEQQPASKDSQEQQQKQEARQAGAPQSHAPSESIEQRAARALLDQLGQDESQLQKSLMAKKMKQHAQPHNAHQCSW